MSHRTPIQSARTFSSSRILAGLLALLSVSCIILAGSARPAANLPTDNPGAAGTVRVGIYDSRAVATAYIRSDAFAQKLSALHAEHEASQKAGDAGRVRQLQQQGQLMQVRMHLQGFSDAPIDDVLLIVRDELQEVAQRNRVLAIVRATDYHDAAVELVDVTDDLVMLFNPDRQTLKAIKELRKHKPQPIEQMAMNARDEAG